LDSCSTSRSSQNACQPTASRVTAVGEAGVLIETANEGSEVVDSAPLRRCPRSLHPALGTLQRLSATLEELQVYEGKRIGQVLGAIAFKDP